MENKTEVPFYGLYGEHFISGDPGFVHIEDIATRSKGLDWLIKPHRHSRLFQLLCVFDGELDIQLNNDFKQLKGSWVVTIPVGTVHGFRFQPNSDGFVLSLNNAVFSNEIEQGYYAEQTSDLLQTPQTIKLEKDNLQFKQFLDYIGLIRSEFSQFRPDQNRSLALLSRLALLTLNRQVHENQLKVLSKHKASVVLGKLRALIESHYIDHWRVADYAQALHISTATLNRFCQQLLDESPKNLIQDRLLTEAKRKLMYTQLPLEEIAYTLGFKDYPYFSRFFKKLAGTTAGVYRLQCDDKIL